jgi:2Fe-2S ferredoxin
MVKLIFVQHDGQQTEVEARVGASVMEAAVENFVPGILAECGGQAVCGTCHAYVDEVRIGEFAEPSETEKELLEGSLEPKANSRLTCQLQVTESMHGMSFLVPEKQY